MFFYLSQFLSFLAMPMTIILILLISGFWIRKKKYGKKLMMIGIILLLLFSNQFLANLAMKAWEPDFKTFDTLPTYEVGIVLTGVTNLNKTAYDRTFFNKGADRATHAVQLYKLGKIKKILITGGLGLDPSNPNTEAKLLRDFMVMTGVPQDHILVESDAKNTRENALFSKEMLHQNEFNLDQKFLLITSAFHMPRSKGCFDKVGLQTDTFPVDYYSEDVRFSIPQILQPEPYSIFMWHRLFKEWIGITVYWMVGYI